MMRPKVPEIFRKKLSAATAGHGVRAEVCRKAGIARNTIERWISGESSPTIDGLDSLADALDMKPWQLIQADDEETVPKAKYTADVLAQIKNARTLQDQLEAALKDPLLARVARLGPGGRGAVDALVSGFEGGLSPPEAKKDLPEKDK